MAKPPQDDEGAGEQAVDWLIRLQEAPEDPELREAFERWRSTSRVNASAWIEIQRTSNLVSAAGQKPRASETKKAGSYGWRRGSAIAVGLAAAIALFVYVPQLLIYLRADHLTEVGEIKRVVLGDGSTAHLAPESAIRIDYSRGKRGVELLKGQAYFDVQRDESRPFSVSFGDAETTVLGTAFEVRKGARQGLVAVRKGKVEVRYMESKSHFDGVLVRGQRLTLGRTGEVARGEVRPGDIAAWLGGKLIVRNRPIDDVLETLRSYFDGAILVGDISLGEARVTGIYDLNDPVEALRAIGATHHAIVRQITPWVLIISRI